MSQVKYKFGVHVSRTYDEAIMLDKANNNTIWQDGLDVN